LIRGKEDEMCKNIPSHFDITFDTLMLDPNQQPGWEDEAGNLKVQ